MTAKRRATVDLAFARLPIAHFFDTVVGGDETERHKPEPEPLLLGLERLGASADQAAYVGDSPYDMQAAKAGGLLCRRRHAGAGSTTARRSPMRT